MYVSRIKIPSFTQTLIKCNKNWLIDNYPQSASYIDPTMKRETHETNDTHETHNNEENKDNTRIRLDFMSPCKIFRMINFDDDKDDNDDDSERNHYQDQIQNESHSQSEAQSHNQIHSQSEAQSHYHSHSQKESICGFFPVDDLSPSEWEEINKETSNPLKGYEDLNMCMCFGPILDMILSDFSVSIVYTNDDVKNDFTAISTIYCSRQPTVLEVDKIAEGIEGQFSFGYGADLEQRPIAESIYVTLYVESDNAWGVTFIGQEDE